MHLPAQLYRRCALLVLVMLGLGAASPLSASGVTVITHGFNSNVIDWVIPMANEVINYPGFPGSHTSCYQISITRNASGQYVSASTFLSGTPPLQSDSCEILVKLDWSTLSGVGGPSTTTVAQAAVNAMLAANLIPQLGGRPLAELPIHLVGHSRGASVVTEMARLFGGQGIWVDHVTTLDPRPVSGFGDASVTSWANVLFADNYWQTMGDGLFVPNGQSLFGAYNRKLTSLSGGYSSSHSDVHLWYHGTIDLIPPAGYDGVSISASQRSAWWTMAEMAGAEAGFRYSLIGGGNRLTNFEPAGTGTGRISDGFNKVWDLGAGLAANRTSLPANAGLWPNAILFKRANSNAVAAGQTFEVMLHHQAGAGAAGQIGLDVFLDPDRNPYNGNETGMNQGVLSKTGPGAVGFNTLSVVPAAATVPPGNYAVCARLTDGARTRHLYASEPLIITPSLQPATIDGETIALSGGVMRFDVLAFPGQQVTVMVSGNLVDWIPLQSQTFSGTVWAFEDAGAGSTTRRYYKSVLAP